MQSLSRDGGLSGSKTGSIQSGMRLMAIVSVATKISALAAQWVLGYLLLPSDFSLYAAVLAVQSMVALIRDAGVGKYLVQSGLYKSHAYPSAIFAMASGMAAAIVICLLAPWFAIKMNQSELPRLLVATALLIPLQSVSSVFTAKLRIDGRHGVIAVTEIASAVLQNATIVILAVSGAGVDSLIVGSAVSILVVLVSHRVVVGRAFYRTKWSMADLAQIWRVCRWIMLGGGASALVLRGDFLVLGFLESKVLVGYYFFGVQIVASVTVLFSRSFQNVIMPAFCRARNDVALLQRTYDETQKALARSLIPLCVFVACAAPAGMNLLWGGKWDNSIIVVQVLVLVFVVKLQSIVAGVLLEACGHWGMRVLLLSLEAVLLMLSVSIVFFWPSLVLLAIVAGVVRLGIALFQLALVGRRTGISQRVLFGQIREIIVYLSGCVIGFLIVVWTRPLLSIGTLYAPLEIAIFAVVIGGLYIQRNNMISWGRIRG